MLNHYDLLLKLLAFYRCAYRAVSCASAAIDACTLVDNIRCALCDSLYRAVACTNTAADAVFSNLISHD